MSAIGFTAEASLYRTNGRYQNLGAFRPDGGGLVASAAIKGIHCVPDDSCATGFSKLFCPSFDPESCRETGICCRPAPPPRPSTPCPPGRQPCTDRGTTGCCPVGAHCCNDNHGCCPDGQTCRSISVPFHTFHFCDPFF